MTDLSAKVINCPVCTQNKIRRISYRNTWSELFINKNILVCDGCGFGHIEEKVDKEELSNFYKYSYRSKESPHYVDFKFQEVSPAFKRPRAIAQIHLGLQYLENKKEYNFLDIGAGLGNSFLTIKEILKEKVNLYALEEDVEAKFFLNKHIGEINFVDELSEIKDRIDFVLLSHSLEHFDISDIGGLLKTISDVMDRNGIMLIEVPHADFRNRDYEKGREKDVPHLCFFSLDSLKKILLTHGFEICFIASAGSEINSSSDHPLIHAEQSFIDSCREFLAGISLYKRLSILKRKLIYKFSSSSNGFSHQNSNFLYNGDRVVLRCLVKKSDEKI